MPAKKPCSVEGVPSRFCIWSMLSVASLKDTFGARLKDTVTEGNKPVWLMASGVVLAWPLATASSGMLPPLGRMKVDVFQSFRALPILGSNFQHHVILIQLRVDDGHFRLAECAVQRRVQRLRGKAELCRGDAIIVHQLIQAAILLVGAHVLQAGQALHLAQQDRSPLGKILHVVGLDRVLIHRIAGPAADAQILHGLEERGSHRQTVQLGAQAVDDLSGADLALRQRLERNVKDCRYWWPHCRR